MTTKSPVDDRVSLDLDFFIWREKSKSIDDVDELAHLMYSHYIERANEIDDAQLKTLTILAIGSIDWYDISLQLIQSTSFKAETKN